MLERLYYEFYDSLDSTNERIKMRAKAGAKEGLVISANRQTEGRGRIGRKWESPKDKCVATSMLLHQNEVPFEAIPSLTIICGLAVRNVLAQMFGLNCMIKWPNDIVINGKKLCGILVEHERLGNGLSYIVIGIGINVHQKLFADDLVEKATSIDMEMKDTNEIHVHRKEIVEAIWEKFLVYYNQFIRSYSIAFLKKEYEKYLVNIGKCVRIESAGNSYEAIANGISDFGGLIVTVDGEKKEIRNYEVSVRGLYGYIA